jgi:DNA-binding NarL/FixJ family response regulator
MDIFMPTMNGVEATAVLLRNHPWMKVMMLTISDKEEDLYSAIKAGASGYLLKNVRPQELVEAIHQVVQGGAIITPNLAPRLLDELLEERTDASPASPTALTARERDVLELVSAGLSNREIAAKLFVSENTIKTHLRNIMDKYHFKNRAEAAAYIARSA